MFFGYRLRDGQAESVVLSLAGARLIHPIKTVKEMCQLVLRDLIAVIDHAQNSVMKKLSSTSLPKPLAAQTTAFVS